MVDFVSPQLARASFLASEEEEGGEGEEEENVLSR